MFKLKSNGFDDTDLVSHDFTVTDTEECDGMNLVDDCIHPVEQVGTDTDMVEHDGKDPAEQDDADTDIAGHDTAHFQ